MMDATARNRTLWSIVAAVAGYGLATVIVYRATGSFGPTWLWVSLAVYGVLLAASVFLAFTGREVDDEEPREPHRDRASHAEAPHTS